MPRNNKSEFLSDDDRQAWGPKLESPEVDKSLLLLTLTTLQFLEQKKKILWAIEAYEKSSSLKEPIAEEVIEESKLVLKIAIGEIVQQRVDNTEPSYSVLYVKRICSILSNIVEDVLKEEISQEKVQLISNYIKYLGEISAEAILPSLIELDNKKGIPKFDLNEYFLNLEEKSFNFFHQAKARKKETLISRMTTGQLCQYFAALAGIVGCFYCGVESIYKTANTVYNKVRAEEFSYEIPLEALTGIVQCSLFFCIGWGSKEWGCNIIKDVKPAYTDLDIKRDEKLLLSSLDIFEINIKSALSTKKESLGTNPLSSLEEASTCPLNHLSTLVENSPDI